MHAKIDLKGGDSVLMRWGKAPGKKRHRIETYEATMVEIDRAQGPKPVEVKFGIGEAAWVAASCVRCVEGDTEPTQGGEPNKQELALKAAQNYENSQQQ